MAVPPDSEHAQAFRSQGAAGARKLIEEAEFILRGLVDGTPIDLSDLAAALSRARGALDAASELEDLQRLLEEARGIARDVAPTSGEALTELARQMSVTLPGAVKPLTTKLPPPRAIRTGGLELQSLPELPSRPTAQPSDQIYNSRIGVGRITAEQVAVSLAAATESMSRSAESRPEDTAFDLSDPADPDSSAELEDTSPPNAGSAESPVGADTSAGRKLHLATSDLATDDSSDAGAIRSADSATDPGSPPEEAMDDDGEQLREKSKRRRSGLFRRLLGKEPAE